MVQQDQWDIALLAIKRSAFILFKASQQVPALEEVYKITSVTLGHSDNGKSWCTELVLTTLGATISVDDFLISLGLNPNDISSWASDPFQTDALSWLDFSEVSDVAGHDETGAAAPDTRSNNPGSSVETNPPPFWAANPI